MTAVAIEDAEDFEFPDERLRTKAIATRYLTPKSG
jgi:hypothetical protein